MKLLEEYFKFSPLKNFTFYYKVLEHFLRGLGNEVIGEGLAEGMSYILDSISMLCGGKIVVNLCTQVFKGLDLFRHLGFQPQWFRESLRHDHSTPGVWKYSVAHSIVTTQKVTWNQRSVEFSKGGIK